MDNLIFSLRLKIRALEEENKKLRFENSCLKIDNHKYHLLLKQYEKIIPEQIRMEL